MQASGTGVQAPDGEESSREAHTVPEVTSEIGDVALGDRDGVVTGDVHHGGVVRGEGYLRVQGAVKGDEQHPCRIEVGGAVTVDGAVEHACISGAYIRVSGDVEGARLTADYGIDVGGDLRSSEASLGNRAADQTRLVHLLVDYQKLEGQLDELRVKVGSAGRRFTRDYPQVDLSMGGIITPLKRELQVDLRPFYDAVKGRPPEEVDKALAEFYMRVMVGSLTRANRHYVSQNPSRQKIFLKLIDELRVHILTVREADKIQELAGEVLKQRQARLDELKRPADIALQVGGSVGADVTIRLLELGNIEGTASSPVEAEDISLEARTALDGDDLTVELTDARGGVQTKKVEPDGLRNARFRAENGRLIWEP